MSRKSLKQQAKDRMGKDYSKSHSTIEKNIGNLERLMERIEEKYGLENINNLKTKHIEGVFADMREEKYAPTTIAAYAAVARDIAEAIGKENIVGTNEKLGASREGTRLNPGDPDLEAMTEVQDALNQKADWLGAAWQVQQAFALRLSEAIKPIKIVEHNDELCLEITGKNARIYYPSIDSPERVEALVRALNVIKEQGGRSLIPPDRTFKQGRDAYRNAVYRAGGTKENKANSHLGRHAYIQKSLHGSVKSAGEDIKKELIEKIGHSSVAKLRHYCPL